MFVECSYVQLLQLISGLARNRLRWLESDHELGAIQLVWNHLVDVYYH